MSILLRFIGWATIVLGLIGGIIAGIRNFSWGIAIIFWISGILSGIIFLALASILDYVEETRTLILLQRGERMNTSNDKQSYPEKGRSKPTLSSTAGDYKMRNMD